MNPAGPSAQARAQPPPPEARPAVNSEEEPYDCLDYYYLRDFPASGAGRSKGRTRRERELRTNRPVPGGHERKIAQKLVNGQRKRRQRQLQPRPRTRLP
ncbi:nuclear protein 2 [Equus asinus]|uniref:Nuclear protein 2, transcriptional regulator n=1 Tax=Equus asinus TaxID=9793 RepID=A0A9L0I5J7_EQUAS|nr:nuclear protein 2 [Equus asinus]XP_044602974.1 nuclear protein 2 [Equus asinus]XP_046524184.1 nuclear protein 2 [Equus quagga]XP_046524185.1 nuclear protein 2 [Equus quagga]